MDFLTLQTRAGPLGFIGRLHTDRQRPALLIVNGSFPSKTHRHDLIDRFPGANVLIANLPGMGGVPWATPTVADLTEGLGEAVARLLPEVPIVAFGASTGNLLSLGLRLPNIRRRVMLEPFFQTKDLWPFIDNSRKRMAGNPGNTAMAHYFWEFFGIAQDRVENRDYRRLLDNITVPTDALMGGAPLLPAREIEMWPSFTSQEDREALAAHPRVTMLVGAPDTGHAFGMMFGDREGENRSTYTDVVRVLHAALLDLAQYCD
jgi:hypothetical protein